MIRKVTFIATGLVVLAGAWYAFRPEQLFIDQVVNEEFPDVVAADGAMGSDARPLYQGRFHGVAHEGKGIATVYRLADGRRILRLTEFETSNGPDIVVYLVAAEDVRDDKTILDSGFVSLGSAKGNVGNQNYEIPSDVDLAKYRSVTFWCRRFGVNFATAPLVNQDS